MPPSVSPPPALAHNRQIESLLAFWADAGVEALYAEAPVDRTVARRTPATAPALPPVVAAMSATPAPPAGPRPPALEFARSVAASARDLAELWTAAAEYLGPVAASPRLVFARGAAGAAVMVIGESPGQDDENAGAPFAGPAGRLLDKMFAAAGLEGRTLLTNTVFWRPPGDRPATADEQALCAPFLERAVQLVAPKALLIVGAGAAKAMLQRGEPILSLHGRWLEWRSADGALEIPALPTLSPAFLLRQPLAKRKSWADLLTLAERVDRPERPV